MLAFAMIALALVALPSPGNARPRPITRGGGFDLRLFRTSVDSKGQFTVNGTDILGAWDVAFGLVMDYGRGRARMGLDSHNGMADRPLVDNQFNGTFIADVGLLNWLVVGATLPFHLYDGPGASPSLGLDPSQYAAPAFLLLRTSDGAQHLRVPCDAGEALIPAEDRQYHRAQ